MPNPEIGAGLSAWTLDYITLVKRFGAGSTILVSQVESFKPAADNMTADSIKSAKFSKRHIIIHKAFSFLLFIMTFVSPPLGKLFTKHIYLRFGIVILPSTWGSVPRPRNPSTFDIVAKRLLLYIHKTSGVFDVIKAETKMRGQQVDSHGTPKR
jgi:hypothetical protein